jgi:hypothetical protein
MTQEALKLALEALTYIYTETTADEDELIDQSITAIKEALAEHAMRETQRLGQEIEQEPPKYSFKAHWEKDGRIGVVGAVVRPDGGVHLLQDFIDPPQRTEQEPLIGCVNHDCAKCKKRTWVGLTGEEMFSCNLDEEGWMIDREVAKRNVEALLKERNT